MPHAIFQLDPITEAVKTLVEQGYSKEVVLGALKLSESDLKKHLNYLYARVFDITNRNWLSDTAYNKIFIRTQEQWANDRLRARGYLFLNDVYEMLGMPQSGQGALVGWYLTEGSNPVEFEIVDETEGNGIILQFNPDGMIYNKLTTF